MAALRALSKTKASNPAVAAADEAVKRRQKTKSKQSKPDSQPQPAIDEYATLIGADGHVISAHDNVEPSRQIFQLQVPTPPPSALPPVPEQRAFDPYEITAAELGPSTAQADWESEI